MAAASKTGDVSVFGLRESVYDYKMVKLELSASCNARCIFCPMFRSEMKPRGFLAYSDAERFADMNADWFNVCKLAVEPFFNGESLLNPNVYDIIDLIVARSIRLGDLDTNLGLVTDISRLARYAWRSITVNIGGLTAETHVSVMGTDFGLVMANLKRLLSESDGKFPIYVKMNPTRENIKQIPRLSWFCAQMGGGLRWKDQQTGIPVPSDCSEVEIREFVRRVYDPQEDRYFRFSPTGDSLAVKNRRCIYQVPCVCSNGDVTICSHDQLRHLSCGNAFVTPLKDVLESRTYKSYQELGSKRNLPFCKGCN